jgi:phosphocarrier protein
MIFEKKVIIRHKQGLHARPAAIFVQIANRFESAISVRKNEQEVNGKSIMGILMLAAEKDSQIYIRAEGSDAKKAVEALEKLLLGDMEDKKGSKEK